MRIVNSSNETIGYDYFINGPGGREWRKADSLKHGDIDDHTLEETQSANFIFRDAGGTIAVCNVTGKQTRITLNRAFKTSIQ